MSDITTIEFLDVLQRGIGRKMIDAQYTHPATPKPSRILDWLAANSQLPVIDTNGVTTP